LPSLTAIEASTDREVNLARLRSEIFDVAIVGGGIAGAAIARDAAMRGLKTAILDKGDFACATSSHSSKLIHGGLRYLPQGRLRLVYRALRERERLRHLTAPHLVRPVKFLFPFYRGSRPSQTAIRVGLIFYDLFALTPSSERHKRLDHHQVSQYEPGLKREGLLGGVTYLDARGDDSRITLENILDAAYCGAVAANYVAVVGLDRAAHQHRRLFACDAESGEAFEIRTRIVVNAAGPWADQIRRMDDKSCRALLRLSKGVHLVVDCSRLPLQNSLVLADGHGRIIFLIRYDRRILIGTTDTDFSGNFDDVSVDTAHADYLLQTVNQSFPEVQLGHGDISACFAGLRSLRMSRHSCSSDVARDEIIEVSRSGLITVAGGKLTTHREIAARTVNCVMEMLGYSRSRSPTETRPLPGARRLPIPNDSLDFLDQHTRQILLERYGMRAELVARIATERPELSESLAVGSSAIAAEVIFAVRHEFARTVCDFARRRTMMAWLAPDAARLSGPLVANLMARELGWNTERRQSELRALMQSLDRGKLNIPEQTSAETSGLIAAPV
jgi:glycerol-3-phosphate dehydrogenase